MDLIGTVLLGRYRIDKKIGEGGMGQVFRAKDTFNGEDVAVKILKDELSLKLTYLRRFKREIKSGVMLEHEGIVGVLDEGKHNGKPFLVMEYVSGQNLRQWVKGKRNDLPLLLEKFEQICHAINYAHKYGIIHRDLKPENVLVTYEGKIKIMDFGLARRVDETSVITSPGTFIGTVVYTSPEQASGKDIDHRCDIYALGVMLFEMILGKLPFKGEDPIGVLFQHIHNPPPLCREINKNIPESLDKLIQKALAKEADKRFQTAGEMALMIRAIRVSLQGCSPKETNVKTPAQSASLEKLYKGRELPSAKTPMEKRQGSPPQTAPESPSSNVEVTFFILELSNFTLLSASIDARAVLEFLDFFSKRVDYEITRHGGKSIQNNGPRVFYIFRSMENSDFKYNSLQSAISCQKAILEMVEEEKWAKPFRRIAVNIGIETDLIPSEFVQDENISKIISRGSFYHTATLIQNQSKALRGNTILACDKTYEPVKDKLPGSLYKKMYVRGKKDPILVYQIDWENNK